MTHQKTNTLQVRINEEMSKMNPQELKYSWSAEVMLNNGTICKIWHTAYPMMKIIIKEIISISSDFPKFEIIK